MDHPVIKAFFDSGPVGQGIISILLVLSIVAWGIIFEKIFYFRKLNAEAKVFLNYFHTRARSVVGSKIMDNFKNESILNKIYITGTKELEQIKKNFAPNDKTLTKIQQSDIEISLQGIMLQESHNLERNIIMLATSANASPLLGLLGTVYGLLGAFYNMGQMGNASIETVGPGIAEALVTTILGLFVAIPSAVGYNYILNYIKNLMADAENYMAEFITLVDKGHFE